MDDIAPNKALNLVITQKLQLQKILQILCEITTNYNQDLALKVELHR
jgi:hypothetical protein